MSTYSQLLLDTLLDLTSVLHSLGIRMVGKTRSSANLPRLRPRVREFRVEPRLPKLQVIQLSSLPTWLRETHTVSLIMTGTASGASS